MSLIFKRGLFVVTAMCFAAPLHASIDAGEIAAAHERLVEDKSFQFEFSTSPAPDPPPSWLIDIAELIGDIIRFISPVIEVIFWLGVCLIAAGAVYLIGREIFLRLRNADREEEVVESAPAYRQEPALARALLEEADRLAAEGRYGDAVRVLLFRSIEDIQRFQPRYVKKAMTSREIGHLSILSPAARTAFAQIAASVEQSHFAGRDIDAVAFADCRAAYGEFAKGGWS